MRELCTTPDKIIKPHFCAEWQLVLTSTRSMKDHHAFVICWPYAMYQTDLTSYAALWQLHQTNLPSCVARRPLTQTMSRLLPSNQEQMRPPLPKEISRLTSHGRINAKGSVYTPVHSFMFKPSQTTFRIVFFTPETVTVTFPF